MAQYQKAIEEFEQAYQEAETPGYLYFIAESYDRLARMPTKTTSEVLEYKQLAMELYGAFTETAPREEPGLDTARRRVESLRQEMQQVGAQVAERESSIKSLHDKLDQILAALRMLQEHFARPEHGVTTAIGLTR